MRDAARVHERKRDRQRGALGGRERGRKALFERARAASEMLAAGAAGGTSAIERVHDETSRGRAFRMEPLQVKTSEGGVAESTLLGVGPCDRPRERLGHQT